MNVYLVEVVCGGKSYISAEGYKNIEGAISFISSRHDVDESKYSYQLNQTRYQSEHQTYLIREINIK